MRVTLTYTTDRQAPTPPSTGLLMAASLVSCVLFWIIARYDYVLFHLVVEVFCMVVGATIFAVVWNAREMLERHYLLVLGIAMLGFVLLDVPHMLTYKGMNVVPQFDSNLPTQLYVAQRYLLSIAFVVAPTYLTRRLRAGAALTVVLAAVSAVLVTTMVWPVFPDAFVEGSGLTSFKTWSDYITSALFLAGAWRLWRARRPLVQPVVMLILGAIGALVASALMFTLYSDPHGPANFLGHLLQVAAFVMLYLAVVRMALVRPYALIFRELAASNERYQRIAETLQAGMLQAPEHLPGVTIAHRYQAASDASRVGGDFYDLFTLDDGRVAVVLGDVAGKGLESASTAAQVKGMIRVLAELDSAPSFVLARANEHLLRELPSHEFATVTYAVIDLLSGRVMHGSAGHPDPVACGAGRCILEELPRNPPLGVTQWPEFAFAEYQLLPGESLLMYTDGITEARNGDELFGETRAAEAIDALDGGGPEELVAGLLDAARNFAGGTLADDVAVVAVRREP